MTIGENIKRIRKERGLTQKELGDLLHMTQSAIGQFENDKTSPKTDTIKKIASALGVSPSELMKGNSMWEEFDRQHPDMKEDLARFEAITAYLREAGFSVDFFPEDEERENYTAELEKDGHKATFTSAEFEELKIVAKEAIEGRFYKKVLEQEKGK